MTRELEALLDIRELLRLQLILGPNATPTDAGPSVLGNKLATVPTFSKVFSNDGHGYVIGVRVKATFVTPGAWIVVAKSKNETATLAQVVDEIRDGLTANAETRQIALLPGEKLFLAAQQASYGGVALSAQDFIQVLISDDANLMSGQNRRFKVV